jgi:hypothetical protein
LRPARFDTAYTENLSAQVEVRRVVWWGRVPWLMPNREVKMCLE